MLAWSVEQNMARDEESAGGALGAGAIETKGKGSETRKEMQNADKETKRTRGEYGGMVVKKRSKGSACCSCCSRQGLHAQPEDFLA